MLGVLLFELMTGKPPFESPQPMQIFRKVMKGIDKASFPPSCQGEVQSVVKLLCHAEPAQRLPMRAGGVQNIRNAMWYEGFDWEAYVNLTMDVPYKPSVRSRKDIANFAAKPDQMPVIVKYVDDGSGWEADFASNE